MDQEREYVTRIVVEIVWTDPAAGRYQPVVHVSGDVPDGLDWVKLADHFVIAASAAMVDPSLAVAGQGLNAAGFIE